MRLRGRFQNTLVGKGSLSRIPFSTDNRRGMNDCVRVVGDSEVIELGHLVGIITDDRHLKMSVMLHYR